MEVFTPRSLEAGLEIRSAHPEAVPVAGGTDLMVDVNFGRLQPAALLDLSRVEELTSWRRDNGSVFVGAGLTFTRIAEELGGAFPLLAQAAVSVGSKQIRNRGTIGGNLATASPAGDAIPVLAVYDADVVVASAARARRVPWREFLVGPKRTSLGPDELIVGVEWQVVDGPGSFTKVGPRNAMTIAVASVCIQLDGDGRVRLALGSVAPTVIRAARAEASATGGIDPAEFGRQVSAEARPIDDLRGSAAYRRHVVEVLARRALARALEERC